MILANKNGWLSVVEVLRETYKYVHLQNIDAPNEKGTQWKLSKTDSSRKLFDNVYDAEKWIKE